MIGILVLITGIIGILITKCQVCFELACVSLSLNLFWLAGFFITRRLQIDLMLIHHRNLNGH